MVELFDLSLTECSYSIAALPVSNHLLFVMVVIDDLVAPAQSINASFVKAQTKPSPRYFMLLYKQPPLPPCAL